MTDIFGFDLEDGLASGGCAVCFALERHMHRWLDSLWREGRQDPETRRRFYAGGGFCRRHAWLLHDLAGDSQAAIADLYGSLAERDLGRLDAAIARARRRSHPADAVRRQERCSACVEEAEALPRKAAFFLELVATESGRQRYERSAGVCFEHLRSVVEAAARSDVDPWLLVNDARRRLAELRERLSGYDRTRDHRFRHERTDGHRAACADVVQHYVGTRR